MIDYYMFEIKPFNFIGQHGGQEKVLHLKVRINGEEHQLERIMPNMQPFENEIQFYSRLANEALEAKLREMKEAEV